MADVFARAGETAKRKGLTEYDPEVAAKGLARLTSGKGIGKAYGKLEPWAIWNEWRDMFVDAPPSPQLIKKAQAMLNEATNWYMEALANADTYERPEPEPLDLPMDELLQELMDKINGSRS